MNWFTHRVIEGVSTELKAEYAAEDSCCQHVEADPAVAYELSREMDSFGPVSTHVMCKACSEAAEKAADEELIRCDDCGVEKPRKEVRTWKWYDFYAPQGDEPMEICTTCWSAEKHRERMRKDREDLEDELDSYER